MSYAVKEIFYTLQGEGGQAGRPAVFCRFTGCNLWSGREQDRATAVCRFCDTAFVGTDGTGGGRFADAASLADAIAAHWPSPECASGISACGAQSSGDVSFGERPLGETDLADTPLGQTSHRPASNGRPFVVCTGGEPLLQVDDALVAALHARGFEVAVETNGTVAPAPAGLDWVCVSPKAGAPLLLTAGDELKLVVPQAGLDLAALETLPFTRFAVQPMAGPDASANTQLAVEICLRRPRWQLSLQTHKFLGIR